MNDSRELHPEKARDEGISAQDDPTEKAELSHVDDAVDLKAGAHKSVGLAVIGQTHMIPTTGDRKVTTKMEYWTYCIFCKSHRKSQVETSLIIRPRILRKS